MARIGTNVTVEVENTLATGLAVSAITKANPGVATATGHSLNNGDVVVFDVNAGMVELVRLFGYLLRRLVCLHSKVWIPQIIRHLPAERLMKYPHGIP